MMLDEGIERLRDLIKVDISKGQAGQGTTNVLDTDTGLENPSADTLNTLDSTDISGITVFATHIVTTAEAVGDVLTEWEIQNAGGSSYNRILDPPLTKDAVHELHYIHSFEIDRL